MRAGQRLEAFSTAFGVLASVAVHLGLFAYVTSVTSSYDFDFDLTLPAEVEFGLTEEMAMEAPAAPGGPSRATSTRGSKAREDLTEPILDAGVSQAPDAGVDDTEIDVDAGAAEDGGTESDADSIPIASPTITGPSRIPPGAQLALRIDMKRIRESPLGPDVTKFLSAIPDWQALLDGSGIDPVNDLDRLLVATPNLERSKLVLAGKHRRNSSFARDSVQRLARSQGKGVRWRQRFGIPTAPWYNRDATRRTIALLSPLHFSITRRQDLARVLALTKARERRDAGAEGLVDAVGPDALLSMGPGEAISLEIEGVHRFVIGNIKHVPTRLRVAVRETGSDEATVTARATYESHEDAVAASEYWRKVATFYSQQLFMTLAGFGKTLRRMELQAEKERVEISFKLNADQIRFILSYAEGRLQGSGGATRPGTRHPGPAKKGP
ncbi:MAG: hypothetical protein PVI24_06525 [Myxococcales bacterium]|jgi:hypothetical protein